MGRGQGVNAVHHEFISVILQEILIQQKILERLPRILKKLFESFKTANDDSPIIEGPHTKL